MRWNVELPPAEWYELNDPKIGELVRAVEAAPVIAIDTETTGLIIHSDMPLFWSLSFDDRRICMPADTLRLFVTAFADPHKTWVFANAKFDLHILANYGINIAGHIADTQVMHALLYEESSHRLKDMALQLLQWKWLDFGDTFRFNKAGKLEVTKDGLGHVYTHEEVSKGAFKSVQDAIMWCFYNDRDKLVEYAANDAFGTWKIYWHLKAELERNQAFSLYNSQFQLPMRPGRLLLKIDTQWDYFQQIEMPFTKVLYYCERNGILVDKEYLNALSLEMKAKRVTAQRKLNQIAGREVNVNSVPQMRKLFIEEMGLKPLKRTKGGKTGVKAESIDKDFVEYYENIEAVALYGEIKKLDKLDGTYVSALPLHADDFGRVHTRFNQDVARTGRLSCVAEWTQIRTPWGLVPIKDLVGGDFVRTHKNRFRLVTRVFTKGLDHMYSMRFSNGEVLTCTADHKLLRADSSWVTAGEVIDELLESLGQRRDEQNSGIVPVPKQGDADGGPNCRPAGHELPQRVARTENGDARGRTQGTGQDQVLGVKVGGQEPDAEQERRGAPSVGGGVRRRQGVPDVHARGTENLRASPSPDASAGVVEHSRGLGSTPHRQRHEEQHHRELGVDHEGRAPTHTLLASDGLAAVTLEEVEYRGCLEVYDMTVDEDASYEACGVFSHNSSDPNMQNIPNAERDIYKIRKAFIPPPGQSIICLDYDQLEMRLLGAASLEPSMIATFRSGRDIHMSNAELIYGYPYDDIKKAKKISKEEMDALMASDPTKAAYFQKCVWARGAVKTVGFGLNYGMKERLLANKLKVTPDEAIEVRERYLVALPAVSRFYEEAIEECRNTGYSYTICGRRRFLPEIVSSNDSDRWKAERQAVNNQIQGTAADAAKLAMINCYNAGLESEYGCRMLLQIHDELIFECPDETAQMAAAEIQDHMTDPFPSLLEVALTASGGVGNNWCSAKEGH